MSIFALTGIDGVNGAILCFYVLRPGRRGPRVHPSLRLAALEIGLERPLQPFSPGFGSLLLGRRLGHGPALAAANWSLSAVRSSRPVIPACLAQWAQQKICSSPASTP